MRLGLIGYGNIGQSLRGLLPPGLVQEVVALVRTAPKAEDNTRFVTSLDALLGADPDLVVECAGHEAVGRYGAAILERGVPLIVVSVGALSDAALHGRLQEAERVGQSRLILPSGAIGGLDLLGALAFVEGTRITYTGTKPPAAWKGSPAEDFLLLDTLTAPATFFKGSARDAAQRFPKNANVVAALALSGPGFDAIEVELVANPNVSGNTHRYEVSSPLCRAAFEIESGASSGNARTSQTTVFSVMKDIAQFARHLKDQNP